MDLSKYSGIETIQEVYDTLEGAEKTEMLATIFEDRTCSYFVRHKTKADVKSILDTSGRVVLFEIDYALINQPQIDGKGSWGAYVILDSAMHAVIERAMWDFDGTVLEGDFGSYAATLARLQAL